MAEYTNDMFGLQQLMKDEQAAKEQSYIDNAYKLGGKRAGMMLYAMGDARRESQAYDSLGRMLTGEQEAVDPRILRMQKMESIQQQFPDPTTEQDFLNLANVLQNAGLPGEAQKAMEMVNSIRSAASAAASATYQDVNGATRYKATGELVPGESATKTTTPTELSLDQLFTNTVEQDPAYIAAVASGNVAAQQKIIATAKRSLALSDDISNQQVQQFTVSKIDAEGNTIFSDVWRSYNKKEDKWKDLESTAQQVKAAATRTYVKDTTEGTFSITEEFKNGKFTEIARTNIDDVPNSFEQAAVMGVLNTPGYDQLSAQQQSELLLSAKQSITIPTTESAINAAYRDINANFVSLAQQEASINGDENFQANGQTKGNKDFFEWKNQLAKDVVAAGGNTSVSDVLGQYKLWNTVSTGSLDSLDQMQNLNDQIALARGTERGTAPNAAAWAQATRSIVALTKDSNLSLAEVQTIANAGSVPRKLINYLNKAITGVPVEATIKEFEEMASGLEKVLINRYNKDHASFNKSFTIAGTDNNLLKSMTGDPLEVPVTSRKFTKNELLQILVDRNEYTVDEDGFYYDENGNRIME